MSEQLTFGLVHGSWHGAWSWELVQEELRTAGYQAVAMDLPIADPRATFDDYADVVVEALKEYEAPILVGHSRAGNVIPRVAGIMAVRKLIYVCGTFDPPTLDISTSDEGEILPFKNFEKFDAGIIQIGQDLTVFDRGMATGVFYHDCPPDISERAVSLLRPQRRGGHEPALAEWPDVPQDYIICADDRAVNPDWCRYVAKEWLGVEPIELAGGHSPFLAQPEVLASLLIALAEDNKT